MSIRFLTKQEPSSFSDAETTATNPWIRLEVKQEISEFSYTPIQEQREDTTTSLPAFQQRPTRTRIPRSPAPLEAPIISFEDAIAAIRNGQISDRPPSIGPLRRPKQNTMVSVNNRPNVVRPTNHIMKNITTYKSLNDEYLINSRESTLDRIIPSSSRSSSHSDDRSSSVELGSGKKYSLMGLSNNEVKERKKTQNILAARRYRQRRNELLNERREEIQKLEDRKADLKLEEASLAGQIQALKDLFAEQLKQRVGGTVAAGNDTKETSSKLQTMYCAAVQTSVDVIEADKVTVEETIKEQSERSTSFDDVEADMITVESKEESFVEKSEKSNIVTKKDDA